jgi:glycosyltransferase 2 family protein
VTKYLRIGISGLLLGFFGWRTDWGDVAERFAGLDLTMWLVACGLLVLGLVGSVRRWQIYGKELGFERTLAQYGAYYCIGMYFNLVLPTSVGGDVMRVAFLNGRSGRKWPAFASVFLERLTSLLVLIALACVGRWLCPLTLPLWIDCCVYGSAAGALLGLMLLCVARRSPAPRLAVPRREQLRLIADLLFCARLWWTTSVLSIVTQGASVALVWCLARSIGLNVPFAYTCVFVPMLTLLTLLPISVNGMGVREAGVVLFLAPLGIDAASAVTLAFLLFAVGAAGGLLGGLVYLSGAGVGNARAEHARGEWASVEA